MPTVHRRPRVRADLDEIWDFIALDGVERADTFIDRLDGAFHTLASQPLIGRSRPELADGLRSFALGRYTIFYEAISDGVVIVRVLHSARDIDAQFEAP